LSRGHRSVAATCSRETSRTAPSVCKPTYDLFVVCAADRHARLVDERLVVCVLWAARAKKVATVAAEGLLEHARRSAQRSVGDSIGVWLSSETTGLCGRIARSGDRLHEFARGMQPELLLLCCHACPRVLPRRSPAYATTERGRPLSAITSSAARSRGDRRERAPAGRGPRGCWQRRSRSAATSLQAGYLLRVLN
jgi:hypothetical protein